MKNTQLLAELKEKMALIRERMRPHQDDLDRARQLLLDTIRVELDEYFHNHEVAGEKYSVNRVSYELNAVIFWLDRESGDSIDEDFDSDEDLDSFLKTLAEHAGVRQVSVPYYYYEK